MPSRSYTVKKCYRFSRPQPGCHKPNSPWPGIIKLFEARESLVSDIPAGDGKNYNLFFSVSSTLHTTAFKTEIRLFKIFLNEKSLLMILFLQKTKYSQMKQFFKNYYITFRVVSSERKNREDIGFGKLKEKETNYERSCVFPHSI